MSVSLPTGLVALLLLGLSIGIPNSLEIFGDPATSDEAFPLNTLVGLPIGLVVWLFFRQWQAQRTGPPRSSLEKATRRLAETNVDAAISKHAAAAGDLKAERRGRKVLWFFNSEDEANAKQLRAKAEDARFEELLTERDYLDQLKRRRPRTKGANSRGDRRGNRPQDASRQR